MSGSPIVHLAGIPGSAKTTFSRWLAAEKDFTHFETDRLFVGVGTPSQLSIIQLIDQPARFIQALKELNTPIVLDWGFRPYHDFDRVSRLVKAGITLWWFDANISAARRSFRKRGDVPIEAFELQISNIQSRWAELKSLIGPNIIPTLNEHGHYVEHQQIHDIIFSK